MIALSPPPYVQATVSDIHRFIADELQPIERDLAAHLTNEHLHLREDGQLAPEVLAAQRTIRKKSAERGLYALHMPKEVGGGGLSLTDMFFVHEAVYQHGIGVTQWMLSWTEGPNQMFMFLTEEQKQKYLLPMMRGEWTAAYAITEYRGGSDVLGMETRAERRGDEWVINGTKAYITNAPYAELIVVCAMTDPSKHSAGGTTFLIERDAPGLRIGRTYRTIMDDGMTGELILDNCRVPLENTWGKEGEGFYLSMGMINWIRMKESGIEKIFRIARNLRIPGGTDEIQRVNIAKALGL